MRRLTYENSRGESIVFYQSPFFIETLTGIGEVDADLQSQRAPYQDGDMHLDTILQPRFPTLEGAINATDLNTIKQHRKRILRVCNPKLGLGKLTLEMDGDRKEIYGALDGVPVFPEKGNSPYQRFMVVWKCPNPYWRSPEQITEPLAAFVPLRTYPTIYPVIYGRRGSEARLYNDGDVPCPVQIELTGPALSPIVTNRTTGDFIRVERELYEGDRMIINTAQGQDRMVAIERQDGTLENAWHYIDIWESTLFNLDVGENVLDYDALTGQGLVTISFNKLFVGV
jgi:hypothetical protein